MERIETDSRGVEVLDLIVDPAGESVRQDTAMRRCELADDAWASRLVASLPTQGGVLEKAPINHLLIGVHREIDRLSQAARHGPRVRRALFPMIEMLRESGHPPPYRIVDQGCGTGFIIRWLAAHDLPEAVELVGVDLNPVLVAEARRLAHAAGLDCRFEVGDALRPDHEATVIMSTALLHHLTPEELVAYFAAQEDGAAVGCLHLDLRPGLMTVVGIALVHRLLMRLPVSRHDGIRSAQRAHGASALVEAARAGAPAFSVSTGGFGPADPLAPMLTMLTALRTRARA